MVIYSHSIQLSVIVCKNFCLFAAGWHTKTFHSHSDLIFFLKKHESGRAGSLVYLQSN